MVSRGSERGLLALLAVTLPVCGALLTTTPVCPVRRLAAQRSSRHAVMVDSSWYLNSLHDHYYLTTAVQACTLVSAGDVFAQLIELRAAHKGKDDSPLAYGSRLEQLCGFPLKNYETARTARMGVLGLFIGGLGTAAWLRYIENTLPLRDSHEYSAYTNLPTWVYAPLLRLFQLEGVDQAVVAECAALPTPSRAPSVVAQRRLPSLLQHGAGDRQSSR